MTAISIQGLTKRFGQSTILRDISLSIEAGEMFFLLGPSGCGKTTLLRHIAGFYRPDVGTIFFDNNDVTHQPAHARGTGMMFQSYALWPHLTVAENVAFGLEEQRRPRDEIVRRVDEALALVKLEGLGPRRIPQLSGGQQQRVALARALVIRPKCLLLDEPLSNLDAMLRLEMRAEIRAICKQFHITAVYVTHDQDEALSMADRIALLDKGQVQQHAAPIEIYRCPANRMVAEFMGETNFIGGTIVGQRSERRDFVDVETIIGVLTARLNSPDWRPLKGQVVTVSVRPEALQSDGLLTSEDDCLINRFQGHVQAVTYLGATAQYQFRICESLLLKVSQINPATLLQPSSQPIEITARADDLVVLPS